MDKFHLPLSVDGYITDQAKLRRIAYGKFGSHYNGCGWIAVYNLLHALGDPVSPGEIHEQLMQDLHFGGRFGTGPFRLMRYLRRRGYRTRFSFSVRSLQNGESGILFYWTGKPLHYVAFSAQKDGLYLFRNVAPGIGETVMEIKSFLNRFSRLLLAVIRIDRS